MYSQNNEDEIILKWFQSKCESKKTPYCVLDIGANDGKTFSNSLLMIENGWEAHLLEPSSVYSRCKSLHNDNQLVSVYELGIAHESGLIDFYESGSFDGNDKALVSCLDPNEMNRWGNSVSFDKTEAQFLTFEDFLFKYNLDAKRFDFISIDAEGFDWDILSQIDLDLHETQCVCIEWNSLSELDLLFTKYCNNFGLYEEERNAENIIFVR
jgi:FkbM family methyltransferase